MQGNSSVATDPRLRRIMAGVHRNDYLDVAELARMPKPGFLIDGVLVEKGLGVLYGPPKIGKSFMALDWALHIAAGKQWCGRETKKGRAMYLLGEGIGGAGARLRAWSAYHKVEFEKFVGMDPEIIELDPEDGWPWVVREAEPFYECTLPLYFPTNMVNFYNPDSAFAFLDDLSSLFDNGIDLLVVDTLARAMAGGDENKVGDVSQVIAIADYIRQETKASVLFVHHSRKGDNVERGSSALRGAVDTMMRLTGKGMLVTDFARDFEAGGSLGPFVFEKVKDSGVMKLAEETPQDAPVGSQDVPRAKILEALYSHPHSSLKELAEAASMALPTADYHLRKLRDAGLAEMREHGRYRLTDLGVGSRGLYWE